MNLCFNRDARFTDWVIREDHRREPFVVIDIGVQGGESPRWGLLGDHLVLHGFDAIKEVVDELQTKSASHPSRRYHWIAAGNEDGERQFFVNRNDPYSSSMYQQGEDRFGNARLRDEEPRRVQVRKLDTLLDEGTIPKADFLKVDVEGFEKDVFSGARKLLRSGLLGIETESSFGVSPYYPKSHLGTLQELLLEYRFLVFDISFNRIPRASFQRALQREGRSPVLDRASVGKLATLDVLFCRDLIDEADAPENYGIPAEPATAHQIIKMMIILELYGLNDIAVDTAERFRSRLSERLDVEHAIRLLANPLCRLSRYDALKELLRITEQITGLRIAPHLRAIRRTLKRR